MQAPSRSRRRAAHAAVRLQPPLFAACVEPGCPLWQLVNRLEQVSRMSSAAITSDGGGGDISSKVRAASTRHVFESVMIRMPSASTASRLSVNLDFDQAALHAQNRGGGDA